MMVMIKTRGMVLCTVDNTMAQLHLLKHARPPEQHAIREESTRVDSAIETKALLQGTLVIIIGRAWDDGCCSAGRPSRGRGASSSSRRHMTCSRAGRLASGGERVSAL